MPIINFYPNDPGHAGDIPAIKRLETNDTIAQITATGYLNNAIQSGLVSVSETDAMLVATSLVAGHAPTQVGWFEVSRSGSNWSLVPTAQPGSVTLPTIANHLAVFTNTTGNLGDDVATAINGGNIQAGLSGTAGTLASFPATAARGSLKIAGVANTGDTDVTISNVAHGQASTYSVPDCGNAAGRILNAATATPFTSGRLISASGTGGLTVDSGVLATDVVSKSASNTFAAAGRIIFNKVNGTEAANAVTASGVAGVITTSALTTAGGANYAITWTNTAITATSVITLTVQGGTNTTQDYRFVVVPGAGTATLTIYNLTAATPLDGTILIGYLVM
jgi:hypothetical protein